jgi:hypothetical protein
VTIANPVSASKAIQWKREELFSLASDVKSHLNKAQSDDQLVRRILAGFKVISYPLLAKTLLSLAQPTHFPW